MAIPETKTINIGSLTFQATDRNGNKTFEGNEGKRTDSLDKNTYRQVMGVLGVSHHTKLEDLEAAASYFQSFTNAQRQLKAKNFSQAVTSISQAQEAAEQGGLENELAQKQLMTLYAGALQVFNDKYHTPYKSKLEKWPGPAEAARNLINAQVSSTTILTAYSVFDAKVHDKRIEKFRDQLLVLGLTKAIAEFEEYHDSNFIRNQTRDSKEPSHSDEGRKFQEAYYQAGKRVRAFKELVTNKKLKLPNGVTYYLRGFDYWSRIQ